jgi:hypothetical protein
MTNFRVIHVILRFDSEVFHIFETLVYGENDWIGDKGENETEEISFKIINYWKTSVENE